MTIESICNQALDIIGYKRHIGSIMDGTPAARVALNAFAEARDEMLAMRPWPFARAFYSLAPSTEAVSPPGLFAFARPASAIVVLDVFPVDPVPLEPEPSRWLEVYQGDGRFILASFDPATVAVTDRVLNPDDWPPDFTLAMIQSLARRFAPLVGAPPKEGDDRQ